MKKEGYFYLHLNDQVALTNIVDDLSPITKTTCYHYMGGLINLAHLHVQRKFAFYYLNFKSLFSAA